MTDPESGKTVRFDGFSEEGAYLEAKGPGYAAIFNQKRLRSPATARVAARLARQAERQRDAVGPEAEIEWHVHDEEAVPAIHAIVSPLGIRVFYTP